MTNLEHASSVAVIAAMAAELRPVTRALRLDPVSGNPSGAREGTAGGRRIVATVTSIGTKAATDVTARLLDDYAVDHLVVIGICGGIDPGLPIGALVVPTETVVEATNQTCAPMALDGHEPTGRLLTTDQLHTDPATVADLHGQGFVAVDMETGAIGAVCEDRDIPWSVFRAVSDRAGDPALDSELLALSNSDGTANSRAVARFLLRHPTRLPKLASLGTGMRKAVATSTSALLAALGEH